MGKGIDNLKLKKRSEKLAFLEIKDGETSKYHRLEGFTTQTHNANASEYDRRYVDEDTNRVDVTGYSESINYNFDYYLEQPALEEIVKITEGEKIGTRSPFRKAQAQLLPNKEKEQKLSRTTYTRYPSTVWTCTWMQKMPHSWNGMKLHLLPFLQTLRTV